MSLEIGKPVEGEFLKGGDRQHLFTVTLSSEQNARIIVEQLGVDVAGRLLSVDGKTVFESNSDPRSTGTETIEFAVRDGGPSTIAILTKQTNVSGKYRIRLETVRSANEKDHALTDARRLNYEATTLWYGYKYDQALPLALKALDIRKRELEPGSHDIAVSLATLANIYTDKGDYASAEPLYLSAAAIREKLVGKDDISWSSLLNNLGLLYKLKGDYVKAESTMLRVLAIRQKNLSPDHLLIAGVLNNLASLKRITGDDRRAADYFERALKIRESALPVDDPEIATSLMNLANVSSSVAVSEPLYRRALAIRENAYGSESPFVAETLYNLANLYNSAGNNLKAEPLARRTVEIDEKVLGPDHPVTAYALDLLASILKNNGDYTGAETMFLRAIAIKEKTQGIHHPDLVDAYSSLSQVYLAKNDRNRAISAQSRANENIEFNLELNLAVGSEGDKLRYLKTLDGYLNRALRHSLQLDPSSADAQDQAVEMVLRQKGRVLDVMADNLGALRRRSSEADLKLLDRLDQVNKKLSDEVLNSAGNSDEYKKSVDKLTDERDKLEDEISRNADAFIEKARSVNLKEIQKLIPTDAVLIEFTVYDALTDKFLSNTPLPPTEPHYAAYILRDHGPAKGVDLGPAKSIDEAIIRFRAALRDPSSRDIKRISRSLDTKIMQPLRQYFGDSRRLLISPDGQLNLIPFETLTGEDGHYLVEKFAVSYLTSGRDLLRLKVSRPSKTNALLISNPLFNAPASGDELRPGIKRDGLSGNGKGNTYFPQLAGTDQETRAIKNLFPDAALMSGVRATEQVIEGAIAPSILHIATHGFFLVDKGPPEVGKNSSARDKNLAVESRNPLLRSGLALAGANQRRSTGGNDGILTALEASGLNLWGTKLVVLSACDTGLGQIRNGEGVYGLRRSFVLAGAETLVMSLWSVSDQATRELMTGFYTNLKSGMGRGSAMRAVQLEILKKKGREHPFYWAGFIESGEWADLNSKR